MAEPVTEAGRELLVTFNELRRVYALPRTDGVTIRAIETEARAALLAELRAAVEGLRGIAYERPEGWLNLIDRAAVLALLEPPR